MSGAERLSELPLSAPQSLRNDPENERSDAARNRALLLEAARG
ncbi:MAG: TetR/AcrR family transcriptional regulator, partial [Mycobacterium sp.]